MIDMYFYETDVLTPTQLNQLETKLEEAKSNLITMGFNIPTYQKTTWSLQSYLLAKYIINIENALKEIADIKGTNIETREWNIDGKDSFSYKDLNRWIKAYNLAYEELGQYYLATFTNAITIENIKSKKLINLQLYGNTTQNGTPTPSTPVPINVVTGGQYIQSTGTKNICFTEFNDWEKGQYYTNGRKVDSSYRIRIKRLIPVQPNTKYYFDTFTSNPIFKFIIRTYKADQTFNTSLGATNNKNSITLDANTYYIGISLYNSTSEQSTNYDGFKTLFENGTIKPLICLNSETNKDYVEYKGYYNEINLGKNLFDKDNANVIDAIINTSTNKIETGSQRKLAYLPIEPNTTYCVSKMLSSRFIVGTTTEVPANNVSVTNKYSANTSTEIMIKTGANDKYLAIFFYHATYDTTITPSDILNTMQVEKGAIATSYSAYKTPIELCKIDTYQDSIKKATGKNLFSGYEIGKKLNATNGSEFVDATGAVSDYIPLSITSTNKFTISGLPNNLYNFVCAYNSNKQFLGRTDAGATISRTLSDTSFPGGTAQGTGAIAYIRLTVYQNSNVTGIISDINKASIMLNSGNTALTYEPYGTGWYIEKQIGKVVLDGSESISITNGGTSNWYYNITKPTGIDNDSTPSRNNALCDFYPIASVGNNNTNQGIYILKSGSIRIRYGAEDTIANFKTWLGNNNITLYYVLASPTYTFIEDEELINVLDNIYTIKPLMNVIYSTSNLQPSAITFEYFK